MRLRLVEGEIDRPTGARDAVRTDGRTIDARTQEREEEEEEAECVCANLAILLPTLASASADRARGVGGWWVGAPAATSPLPPQTVCWHGIHSGHLYLSTRRMDGWMSRSGGRTITSQFRVPIRPQPQTKLGQKIQGG